MPTYRYYLLDSNGGILTADYVDSADLNAAIIETHGAQRTMAPGRVCGFEIWQESELLHREAWQNTEAAQAVDPSI